MSLLIGLAAPTGCVAPPAAGADEPTTTRQSTIRPSDADQRQLDAILNGYKDTCERLRRSSYEVDVQAAFFETRPGQPSRRTYEYGMHRRLWRDGQRLASKYTLRGTRFAEQQHAVESSGWAVYLPEFWIAKQSGAPEAVASLLPDVDWKFTLGTYTGPLDGHSPDFGTERLDDLLREARDVHVYTEALHEGEPLTVTEAVTKQGRLTAWWQTQGDQVRLRRARIEKREGDLFGWQTIGGTTKPGHPAITFATRTAEWDQIEYAQTPAGAVAVSGSVRSEEVDPDGMSRVVEFHFRRQGLNLEQDLKGVFDVPLAEGDPVSISADDGNPLNFHYEWRDGSIQLAAVQPFLPLPGW